MGVLGALASAGDAALSPVDIAAQCHISRYAARVLLDACSSLDLVAETDGTYRLLPAGQLVLEDPVVRVNFDFAHEVCHQPAFHLQASLAEGRPAGLSELGPWSTVYEGLTHLEPSVRRSWFAFDHFYSDRIFAPALKEIERRGASTLLDVGCNSGRFSAAASKRFDVVGVDHPAQLALALQEVGVRGNPQRFRTVPLDLLDPNSNFPSPFDAVWMSQLLDCFGETDIVRILSKARAALARGGRVYVAEPFSDRQRSLPARIALHGTSLYFACVANGSSRMYRAGDLIECARHAGFAVEHERPLGPWHTLLVLQPHA